MSQAEFTEDWFRRRPAVPQAGPAPGRCCLTPELPALFAFLRVKAQQPDGEGYRCPNAPLKS